MTPYTNAVILLNICLFLLLRVARGIECRNEAERFPVLPIYPPTGASGPLARLIFFWCISDKMLSKRTDAVYEFGPFRLEVKEHRLVREGRSIPLTGKAFETLRVLLERHGTLVSKRDLMNAVWPDTAVEENNLVRNISALRKALGEKATARQYIETVPRVGYRFVARLSGSAADEAVRAPPPLPDISPISS